MSLLFGLLIMGIQLAIPGLILAGVILLFLRTILPKEKKELRIAFYTTVITLCSLASIIFALWRFEKPSELYLQMQEINNSQSLVGLSREEVDERLGEPLYESNNSKKYSAGEIRTEWCFGQCYSTDYYSLYVSFDENGKVEHTSINLIP